MDKIKRWHWAAALLISGIGGALFFRERGEAALATLPPKIMPMEALRSKVARLELAAASADSRRSFQPAARGTFVMPAQSRLPASPSPDGVRKLVKEASIRIEIGDYEKDRLGLAQLAARHGAEIIQEGDNGGEEWRSGFVVLSVSPERLDALLGELGGLGRVMDRHVSVADRGEEYVDLRARLENLRKVEGRLTQLLSFKTNKLADVLQVERELERVGAEMERLQGKMNYIDRLAARSRLTVSLQEPVKNAPRTSGLLYEIRNRLVAAINVFVRTGLSLLSFTVFLLAVGLWAGAIGGGAWLIYRLRRAG
ncbi:MAG: DUF4349 domain-containing protein [Elusimicrobia bacterium]|nr:DUF4349 domain-containing protein [Elusimicrobiota bacterium]